MGARPVLAKEMPFSSIIKGFSELRVFVIGDVMLDRYAWGRVTRISPEAPVPVLKVSGENFLPGGAANVASNLRGLGASVRVSGVIGGDYEGEKLLELLREIGVDSRGIILDPKRLTTTKTRLIAESQQIARMDREEVYPISDELKNRLIEAILESVEEHSPHGIIISDYAKGAVTEELSHEVIRLAKSKGIFVAVDPKGSDFSKYRGASVITPNQKEAEEVCGFSIADEKTAFLFPSELPGSRTVRSLHPAQSFPRSTWGRADSTSRAAHRATQPFWCYTRSRTDGHRDPSSSPRGL